SNLAVSVSINRSLWSGYLIKTLRWVTPWKWMRILGIFRKPSTVFLKKNEKPVCLHNFHTDHIY
ncbi:hypothetical protein, partial [Thalassotalea mangrovi]|uniref:hypothetical protein n=1 Tax=Thalassotalea mangrovi TaxID=2572245 RepID=UPI001B802C56